MPKKAKKKHPKHMTTKEAAEHLFHPEVLQHVKKHTKNDRPHKKKSTP